MAQAMFTLTVDMSDLKTAVTRLQMVMKPDQFRRAMYGIYKRTGGHVKRILSQDLPKEYHVKVKDIRSAVKNPKMTTEAGMEGCVIPISDVRGSIGGRYKASGGARGWRVRDYRVKAKIVKSAQTTLPVNMPKNYGGMKPFRNLSATQLHNVAFTRVGQDRLPIKKITGIGIPQMPMNRSQDEVQKDIHDYLAKEIERRFMALMKVGR